MKLSLIVAMSENGVIGRGGTMPWHLSADLRRFRRLTMGHHLIMGRKTYKSIGRLLPGRTTIIMTRSENFRVDGALMASDLRTAIEIACEDSQVFVIGGGEIYQLALSMASTIYLTRVHTVIDDGDTMFPDVDWSTWDLIESIPAKADKNNDFDYTFEIYERNDHHRIDQAHESTAGKRRQG